VLVWKPDLIITPSKEFAAQVYNDTVWQLVPAVQNRRVYLTPSKPYNRFDRPLGVNRIVGIPWTAHLFYPDLFSEEWFRGKAKEFYAIFYLAGVKGAEREDPTLQGGDESRAALRHTLA